MLVSRLPVRCEWLVGRESSVHHSDGLQTDWRDFPAGSCFIGMCYDAMNTNSGTYSVSGAPPQCPLPSFNTDMNQLLPSAPIRGNIIAIRAMIQNREYHDIWPTFRAVEFSTDRTLCKSMASYTFKCRIHPWIFITTIGFGGKWDINRRETERRLNTFFYSNKFIH